MKTSLVLTKPVKDFQVVAYLRFFLDGFLFLTKIIFQKLKKKFKTVAIQYELC